MSFEETQDLPLANTNGGRKKSSSFNKRIFKEVRKQKKFKQSPLRVSFEETQDLPLANTNGRGTKSSSFNKRIFKEIRKQKKFKQNPSASFDINSLIFFLNSPFFFPII